MSLKKIVRKTFLVLCLIIITLVSAVTIITYLYKDELIAQFIREANKNINTPVHVDKITVSSFKNFPQISLTFHNVYVEESYPTSTYPLLQAEKLDFTFNPIAIFKGDFTVEEIHISKGTIHLKMDSNGEINYNIVNKPQNATDDQKVKLSLSKIELDETTFTYTNDYKNVNLELQTKKTLAKLQAEGKTYHVETDGDVYLQYLLVQNRMWLENKDLKIDSKFIYNDEIKDLQISPSEIAIKGSKFSIDGKYTFLNENYININFKGNDTNIQTLWSLLPEEKTSTLKKYESEGEIYFNLNLNGIISEKASPALNIDFGLKKAELLHPENNIKITNADLKGYFHAPQIDHINNGSLTLEDISGTLENKSFTANLMINNFNKPYIKGNFAGQLDIHSIFKFYQSDNIKSGSGLLDANISFEGHTSDLKQKATTQKFKTTGDINLNNLSLHLASYPLPLSNLSGNLLFNNNNLALSDVRGKLGNSDFLLNGFFKNIIAYLLFEDEPVGIEADLDAATIDLDELLAANPNQNPNAKYTFNISPRLVLNFNCNIDHLKFRRFHPSNLSGNLKVKNKVAQSDKIKFKAIGGDISISGKVDASYNNLVKVNTEFDLTNINVDSIFYLFEDFNQDFLQARHLKGKIFATVAAEMTFNNELHLYPNSLTSNISTRIEGGELNNFEPMQKLSKYLDHEKLDRLRFSELRNDIHIENKKIYLPEMEVSSNVTDIMISGTHTFDQNIDYRIAAPLNNKRRVDKDEAFGAIEQDDQGRTMLYLKIIGNTSDYVILYDKNRVKKKIVNDIKKEAQELKDAFKNKGKEEKEEVELKEDDYFDWDN